MLKLCYTFYTMSHQGFWVTVTSKFFLAAASLALLGVAYGVIKGAIRRAEIEREVRVLQSEISEHKLKNEQLTRLIDYLGTAEFQEREARLQLGLQKPGENVVVIPDLATTDASKPGEQTPAETRSNFELWLDYLLGMN